MRIICFYSIFITNVNFIAPDARGGGIYTIRKSAILAAGAKSLGCWGKIY